MAVEFEEGVDFSSASTVWDLVGISVSAVVVLMETFAEANYVLVWAFSVGGLPVVTECPW